LGTQLTNVIKTTTFALALIGLAACSSTSETEPTAPVAQESSGESAAARAARMEQERLERERMEEERREEAALNTTVFYFDFDVAEFKAADRETLVYHARNLASNPSSSIRLEGHADVVVLITLVSCVPNVVSSNRQTSKKDSLIALV